MPRNVKDTCPIKGCGKSIQSDPSHFAGKPASPPTMLRCVLYQMYVSASSTLAMRKTDWGKELTFQHPKLGAFTPNESLRIAALISFRILYDFFYNSGSEDDFSVRDFTASRPTKPTFVVFEGGKMFTKESINKYIAHLTWARINKPKCIPQPRFRRDHEATILNAKMLLRDAEAFVGVVCNLSNPNRIILDKDGLGYRKIFDEAFAKLLNA